MNKRIYYHNSGDNQTPIELAHFWGKGVIHVYHDEGISIISFSKNTYRVTGNPLPSIVKIYRDESEDKYYIVKNTPPYGDYCSYWTIWMDTASPTSGGIFSGKGQAFDDTGLTLCTQTNATLPAAQNTDSGWIDAGATYNYTSKSKNGTYATHSSLILIDGRDTNGVWFCGLYLIYKQNADSTATYEMETLFSSTNASQFYVTPTTTGVSMTHNPKSTRYHIVELATELQSL